MLSWMRKPDIPFSREDANRYLPWVIAVMVCLVGLMISAGISFEQASARSGQLNIRSFQIYVPYSPQTASKTQAVRKKLETFNAIERVEQVDRQTLQSLITPWTGTRMPMEQLPLPAVLEVTLKQGVQREAVIGAITTTLQAIDAAIDVESYQNWVNQLMQFTGMLRLASFIMVAVLLSALMVLVAIIVRTSLKLHFQTVRLLHNVGATDDYIIQQFVTNSCLLVLKGSVMGMGIASAMLVAFSYLSHQLSSPLMPAIHISLIHGITLVVLPLLLVLLTFIVVRVTIMSMLEHMH